jgi:hypothetical protein
MVELPILKEDPTINALYAHMEAIEQDKPKRSYLGASLIGNECVRQIWYKYNDYPCQPFSAKTLMNFEDGHRTEELTANRLRLIPEITLKTHDDNGNQMGFSALGGKFKGHWDGVITGILQAPKTPHIWECKASAYKKFNEFKAAKQKYNDKSVLENWNKNYHVQAQLYMHYSGLDRHYTTVAYAGGRDYLTCRTEYKEEVALRYIDRAEKIINADTEPPRISEKEDFFICRFCEYKDVCHGK